MVALQIAYLPTLYASFSRRETEVTLIGVRAGHPPWGPELLARNQMGSTLDDLRRVLPAVGALGGRRGGEPRELSDPVAVPLARPTLIVADRAAGRDGLRRDAARATRATQCPLQARLSLRMGIDCLRQLATTIGIPFDDDPRPDMPIALSREEFDEGFARLAEVGFVTERDPDESWRHFSGWRVNYEAIAYRMASAIDAVPARWSGPRRANSVPRSPSAASSTGPRQPRGDGRSVHRADRRDQPRRLARPDTVDSVRMAGDESREPSTTVFEAVGGMAFFEELVDRFYEGVAGDDALLALYPDPEDLAPARRHLALFLAQYWGGPTEYSALRGHPALRMRHAPFAIGIEARDRWLLHMRAALRDGSSRRGPSVRGLRRDGRRRAAEPRGLSWLEGADPLRTPRPRLLPIAEVESSPTITSTRRATQAVHRVLRDRVAERSSWAAGRTRAAAGASRRTDRGWRATIPVNSPNSTHDEPLDRGAEDCGGL